MCVEKELFLMTIRLFLSSLIFIIGAYLIERLNLHKKSDFADLIKNIFIILSVASLILSAISCGISAIC